MKTKLMTLVICSIMMCGCFQNNHKFFSIRFENKSDKEIQKIELKTQMGAYSIERYFSPGDVSTFGLPSKYNANEIYFIEWQYYKNKKYYKEFDLRDKLPEDFKGHIVFSFNQNNDVDFYQWMSPYQYDYSVELENKSNTAIYKPFIKSSKGILFIKYKDVLDADEEIRVWNLKSFPANSIYTISWISKDGTLYSEEIDFTNMIEENFSGVIQFTITKPAELKYSIESN